jgi:hypothetical protein
MATVNLGSIKFKWKGTYSGATAYTVDDVVEYNGSSYICILASTGNLPTNATYFEQMSQKGTDADLLSIASTAQGDIYYNNGGAIARLGAGTNGQALLTGGAGANPSWGDAGGGKINQVLQTVKTDTFSTTNGFTGSGMVGVTGLSVAITPSDTSSKILVSGSLSLAGTDRHYCRLYINGSLSDFMGGVLGSAGRTLDGHYDAGTTNTNRISFQYLHSPNSTSTQTYQWYVSSNGGDGTTTYVNRHGATSGSSPNDNTSVSEITVMEVLA